MGRWLRPTAQKVVQKDYRQKLVINHKKIRGYEKLEFQKRKKIVGSHERNYTMKFSRKNGQFPSESCCEWVPSKVNEKELYQGTSS